MLNIFNLLQGLVITILLVNIKKKFQCSFLVVKVTSLAQRKPFRICKVIIKTNMLLAIVSLLSIEGTLLLT